jgi:hypothetical protein
MYASPLPLPPRVCRGVSERLREALEELCDGHARIVRHGEKSWASITFAGARHRLELDFQGAAAVEAGETFIATLAEHEFTIPGHLVAEATVIAADHSLDPPHLHVTCELLLLEDS